MKFHSLYSISLLILSTQSLYSFSLLNLPEGGFFWKWDLKKRKTKSTQPVTSQFLHLSRTGIVINTIICLLGITDLMDNNVVGRVMELRDCYRFVTYFSTFWKNKGKPKSPRGTVRELIISCGIYWRDLEWK